MRGQVVLDEVSGDIWPEDFNLESLKSSTKLTCLLEVIGTGGVQPSALSSNSKFLAVVTQGEDASNRLFIIHLNENRFYLLKRMAKPCTVLMFHPYVENRLFLATAASKIYSINADDGSVVIMEGHSLPVNGLQLGARSPLVLSYNTEEVFLWSWPSLSLTNKLRLEDRVNVVWAGHVWQRNELVVCFANGSLIIWPSQDLSTQIAIEPPRGLDFDFTAFALSRGGEWVVGGGKSHLVVTYSLIGRRVSQIAQLPSSCNNVYQAIFLPPVNPKFSQVLAVLNTTGVLNVIDFSNTTKLKTLRSQRFNIDSVSVSEDGNFLAVAYANCITKVYPVSALFPEDPQTIELQEINRREIDFKIIEKMEAQEVSDEEKDKPKHKKHKELKELLDRNKWYPILIEFREYPEKYRNLIWVSMLQLPRNYLVFSTLLDKGMHSAFEGLKEVLKLSDGALLKTLQGTLSCLAHWAPFLSSVEYLPELVFPFVKFFHSNRLLCFEVSATFILNWCRLWFEFWPKPGVTVLTVIERMVCEYDPVLLAHLMKLQVTAEDYAWTLLTNAFSRVFPNDDWLILWDHIFSNPPAFLPCVVAAFTIKSRRTLMTCEDAQEVKAYYSQETWISIRRVLDKAYHMYQNSSAETLPKDLFGELKAIPKGGLPVFNIGPRDAREDERENVERKLRNLGLRTEAVKQTRTKRAEHTSMAKEDMVYKIGRKDLEQQEEECLNSIMNLRKRHLATAELDGM